MRIQWDGHTHSEFCPHGSKNKTIAMVERAIQLDFTHYSITEHAPLPPDLLSKKTTSQDSSMKWEDLESYWKVIQELKTAYKGKIEILIGLEIDYLLGYENFTQEFLESNQSKLDEIILSLHFLPDKNKNLKIIDKCWESFEASFMQQGKEKLWELYWQTIEKMVSKKWQFTKPIRIGHLALIEKYNRLIKPENSLRKEWKEFALRKIIPKVAKQGYSLDFNVSGLRKKDCGMPYLYTEFLESCKKLGITLVYEIEEVVCILSIFKIFISYYYIIK